MHIIRGCSCSGVNQFLSNGAETGILIPYLLRPPSVSCKHSRLSSSSTPVSYFRHFSRCSFVLIALSPCTCSLASCFLWWWLSFSDSPASVSWRPRCSSHKIMYAFARTFHDVVGRNDLVLKFCLTSGSNCNNFFGTVGVVARPPKLFRPIFNRSRIPVASLWFPYRP